MRLPSKIISTQTWQWVESTSHSNRWSPLTKRGFDEKGLLICFRGWPTSRNWVMGRLVLGDAAIDSLSLCHIHCRENSLKCLNTLDARKQFALLALLCQMLSFKQAFMYEPRSLACETPSTPSMPEGCEWADSFLQTQKFHPYSQRREHAQVDCTPPGNILAKVVKSRNTGGNYIGFALMAIAGEGTITAVDIKGQGDVRFLATLSSLSHLCICKFVNQLSILKHSRRNWGTCCICSKQLQSFHMEHSILSSLPFYAGWLSEDGKLVWRCLGSKLVWTSTFVPENLW